MDIAPTTLQFTPAFFTSDQRIDFLSHSVVLKRTATFADIQKFFLTLAKAHNLELVEVIPEESVLKIENVRELQAVLALRSSRPQLVLIRADKLPIVTQNALLKLLEEGAPDTTVVLVVLPSVVLLNTLVSRVSMVEVTDTTQQDLFKAFIAQDITTRLKHYDELSHEQLARFFESVIQNAGTDQLSPYYESVLRGYQAWQTGALVSKYYYEYLSLIIPNKSQ